MDLGNQTFPVGFTKNFWCFKVYNISSAEKPVAKWSCFQVSCQISSEPPGPRSFSSKYKYIFPSSSPDSCGDLDAEFEILQEGQWTFPAFFHLQVAILIIAVIFTNYISKVTQEEPLTRKRQLENGDWCNHSKSIRAPSSNSSPSGLACSANINCKSVTDAQNDPVRVVHLQSKLNSYHH